jgi:hypothetical protein
VGEAILTCCRGLPYWKPVVDRFDDGKPIGVGPLHFHRITRVEPYLENGKIKIARATPTWSIAATISSPVT